MMKICVILCAILVFANTRNASAQQRGPHVFVYKTKKDRHKLVPVQLSDDRMKVVSYPDPHDIKSSGERSMPELLHKRYYLDNYGINANTAFLKLTYEEYAALKHAPSADELYKMIDDANPLTVVYDCGPRSAYRQPIQELNRIIDKRELGKKCKKMNVARAH